MCCDSHSQRLQLSSVQSLSHVQLFVTPWITAHQASLCLSPTPRVHPNSCPLSWWCGLSVVNKTEVDGFLELCFFDDPTDVGNLISGSSTFSKSGLNIWNFTVHVLLKPGLEDFEHYFTSIWNECKWQPTPVFLHGKSQGWRSLVSYSPWGHYESDTTERLLSLSLWTYNYSTSIHFKFAWTCIIKVHP